jgi:nucleotide-binding universal stress UspA family protein
MKPIKTILAPTDFSECAHTALQEAIGLAQKLGAELTLFHTYQLPAHAFIDGTLLYNDEIRRAVETQASTLMSGLKAEAERRLERPVRTKLAMGTPYAGIVEEAQQGNYDLIVIGTHGRTGIKHFVLGSVAERVVQLAPCRVLTTRGGDKAA